MRVILFAALVQVWQKQIFFVFGLAFGCASGKPTTVQTSSSTYKSKFQWLLALFWSYWGRIQALIHNNAPHDAWLETNCQWSISIAKGLRKAIPFAWRNWSFPPLTCLYHTWYPKQAVLNGWNWLFPTISYIKLWSIIQLKQPFIKRCFRFQVGILGPAKTLVHSAISWSFKTEIPKSFAHCFHQGFGKPQMDIIELGNMVSCFHLGTSGFTF